jgi:hypothetical protein
MSGLIKLFAVGCSPRAIRRRICRQHGASPAEFRQLENNSL